MRGETEGGARFGLLRASAGVTLKQLTLLLCSAGLVLAAAWLAASPDGRRNHLCACEAARYVN